MKLLICSFLVLCISFIACDSYIDTIAIQIINIPPPSDSTIAFVTTNNDLGFHIAIYNSLDQIVKLTSGTFDTDVCWTPDKSYIFYTKLNRDNYKLQIWRMSYDGSNKKSITPPDFYCKSPQVSPNGQLLTFTARIDNLSQIIITDISGEDWQQITNPGMFPNSNETVYYLPSWLPDNKHILFTYHKKNLNDYDPPRLGKINIYSKEIICFTKIDSLLPHHAKWSPTREEIVFVGIAFPGDQIYRIDANQKNLVKLSDSFIANFPDWSSDGERILFAQKINSIEEPDAIWVMNRDGSKKRLIIAKDNELCSNPCW